MENTLGRGGQRTIVVYCPYWIVNTTQFKLRIKEDGSPLLPAGSVTNLRLVISVSTNVI